MRGPCGRELQVTSRSWEWPEVASKKMGTWVLQPQGNEFCQQAEVVELPQWGRWWDHSPTDNPDFSLVRPWSCESRSASCAHTAGNCDTKRMLSSAAEFVVISYTAVEKEYILDSRDFTFLWYSPAQQVLSSLPGSGDSQVVDDPRINMYFVRQPYFSGFSTIH